MHTPKFGRRRVLITGTCAALLPRLSGGNLPADAAQDCRKVVPVPTGEDVEGPFFRAGAPRRTVLHQGIEDEILTVSGTVTVRAGTTYWKPVAQARIEIWHASPAGLYDNETDAYLYRAHFDTDEQGHYRFQTATPGGYRDGPFDRPAHIHYKVIARGCKPLTTQLYFRGDTKLEQDVFVRENDGLARAVYLERTGTGKFRARFDIRLEPSG